MKFKATDSEGNVVVGEIEQSMPSLETVLRTFYQNDDFTWGDITFSDTGKESTPNDDTSDLRYIVYVKNFPVGFLDSVPVDALECMVTKADAGDVVQTTAAAWLEELREAIAENRNSKALIMIDNMPPELKEFHKLGKGMVVLPDAEHMTEEMIDATRGLHLYYMEGGSGVSCENMRMHLRRFAPWSEKHWPVWFAAENDHLTKAGRAIVAHALTVGAFNDPDAKPKYFSDEGARRQRIWDQPMHRRIQLSLIPLTETPLDVKLSSFTIRVPFIHASLVGENEFLLQLNRTDIPKYHRKKFKQLAITVKLKLVEEGTRVEFGEIVCNTKESACGYMVTPAMVSRF